MTLRFLLTLEMVFLLVGTSFPGRPLVLGVVVEAYRAHLGGSAISPGATVYDGDHFSTEEGGARCGCAAIQLCSSLPRRAKHWCATKHTLATLEMGKRRRR